MVIAIKELKRPGIIYDSSKLAILGNMIAGSIKQRTKGEYIANSTISGRTIEIRLKKRKENGEYIRPTGDEQEILAGRISNFLNSQGISHEVSVK